MHNNKKNTNNKIIVISGPTTTGKTFLAIEVANKFNGEIISIDSRQVYKYLNLGTGKDLEEYSKYPNINYHLINIISPCNYNKRYNVKQFYNDATSKISEIHNKNKIPILVGGSFLYLDAIRTNYSFSNSPFPPDNKFREFIKNKNIKEILAYAKNNLKIKNITIDNINNKHRLIRFIETYRYKHNITPCIVNNKIEKITINNNYEWLMITPYFQQNIIYQKAKIRLYSRIRNGLIKEVNKLYEYYKIPWEHIDSFGLEYRYVSQYIRKKIDFEQMIIILFSKIKKLIRTQNLWIRKLESKNIFFNKIINGNIKNTFNLINNFLFNEISQEL